jgi:hypothetical protein
MQEVGGSIPPGSTSLPPKPEGESGRYPMKSVYFPESGGEATRGLFGSLTAS